MDDVGTFDRFAWPYDVVMPRADAAALRTALVQAERPVERVVDLAGGSGRGVRAVDANERIVVDAAPGMASRVRAHGLAAIVGDAGRVPIGDETTDAVLVVDALHHLPDRDVAIAEAARILRPGGVLIVADFDPTTLRGRALVAAEHLVGFESRFDTPDALADRVARDGLAPTVVDGGFGYVVAGLKDRGGASEREESRDRAQDT